MRIPGTKHLRIAGRWLRSRLESGGLILGYHRISDETNDVYSTCVRPQYFAEQMEVLKQQANPIQLDDLIAGLKSRNLPPRAVAVTFDDGYADNLYQAKPLLDTYKIPVTLFVATGYLGRLFWWDELVCLLLDNEKLPPELIVHIAGEPITWRISNDSDLHLLLEEIYMRLLRLTAEQRQRAMEHLSQQTGTTHNQSNCSSRALTPEELIEFSSDDLVMIGAHSVTHPFLASMSEKAQRLEIEQSKRDLEALLGRPVKDFSYPNGSSNKTTRSLLREAGFGSACASYNDVANPGTDLFNLPRFWVPDQDGDKFVRWLRLWLS